MDPAIIIVSGLPRSGTSVMMQMLDYGGLETVTDNIRGADTDNPRGYYEFEQVKKVKADASWLPGIRGKAVKMVSQLLYDLPPNEKYQIVFMERDFDEMLESQEKMLKRLGRPAAPRDKIKDAYVIHLKRLFEWLKHQRNMQILCVNYNKLMQEPGEQARRVSEFLEGKTNIEEMVKAVDPALYRNRNAKTSASK